MTSSMNAIPRSFFTSIIVLIFLHLSLHSQAQVLPSKTWKTVRVGDFELIYDTEHQELAEIYAARLAKLSPLMHQVWKNIPRKTSVVLNDNTDLTNGFATPLPYPYIMVFPVLPGPMDTIGEYNDWAWELLAHEYTHILSFEQRRGVVEGLSHVFGTIITPNMLLPSWWLEGVAVEGETRLSAGGRLRSKMQEASVRAMVLAGTLQKTTLAQINEAEIPTWPYGSRPYLLGSLLWSEMVADKGEKVIGELHDRLGGRAPYLINDSVQDLFGGKDRLILYRQMQASATQEAESQLQQLRKIPFTKSTVIDPEVIESLSPALSPDGMKLAYVAKNKILRRRVQVLVRAKNEEAFSPAHKISNFGKDWDANLPSSSLPRPMGPDAPPGGNITRVSWHPNSQVFAFDQVIEKNRFEEYSDLWLFELGKGKAERITFDGRAREPSFSPDGKQIAYVHVQAGVTHLYLWDVQNKKASEAFHAPMQDRVSFPAWLDQDRLIFSLRENGQEKALIKNLKSGEVTEVLKDYKDPLYFTVEKDRLLFTSTRNGVRNLYQTDLQLNHGQAVTHSATHIFTGAYDPGTRNYLYTELEETGLSLRSTPENEIKALAQGLPSISPFWEKRYPPRPFEKSENTNFTSQAEDYSPYGYLWPRYWLPFIGSDSQGLQVTVSTSGQDPLLKHSYFLTAGYDSTVEHGNVLFTYTNQVYWPAVQLLGYDLTVAGATRALDLRTQAGQLGFSWEVQSISPDWYISMGWQGFRRTVNLSESNQQGPYIGTAYSNALKTPAQVTPESGWAGSLVLSRLQVAELGRYNSSATAGLTTFWSSFLPARHALMARVLARYSDSLLRMEDMEQTSSILTSTSAIVPAYLMRGYLSGSFAGRQMVNPTLEYRFPITRLDAGPDMAPFYFGRLYGAIVADGLFFDGFAFETNNGTTIAHVLDYGRGFWDAGFEIKMDTTLGYHYPLTFYTGVYWPLNVQYVAPTPQFALGLLL